MINALRIRVVAATLLLAGSCAGPAAAQLLGAPGGGLIDATGGVALTLRAAQSAEGTSKVHSGGSATAAEKKSADSMGANHVGASADLIGTDRAAGATSAMRQVMASASSRTRTAAGKSIATSRSTAWRAARSAKSRVAKARSAASDQTHAAAGRARNNAAVSNDLIGSATGGSIAAHGSVSANGSAAADGTAPRR